MTHWLRSAQGSCLQTKSTARYAKQVVPITSMMTSKNDAYHFHLTSKRCACHLINRKNCACEINEHENLRLTAQCTTRIVPIGNIHLVETFCSGFAEHLTKLSGLICCQLVVELAICEEGALYSLFEVPACYSYITACDSEYPSCIPP